MSEVVHGRLAMVVVDVGVGRQVGAREAGGVHGEAPMGGVGEVGGVGGMGGRVVHGGR